MRRIRYTPTVLAPLVVGALSAVPFAAALGSWGLLVAVPFVLAAIVLRRVGLDVLPDEVRVRNALSSSVIPRSELIGFTVDRRHVGLVRADESTVRIPTVRPRDLPMLRQALFPDDATHLSAAPSESP